MQGAPLSFSYAIRNQGVSSAGLNLSSWAIDQKPLTSSLLSDTIGSLAAGATTSTFSHSIDTTSLTVGMHTLWVAADFTNQVSESDETNNWTPISFTVTQPPLPDLIVSSLTLGAISLMQGASLSFSYAIRNLCDRYAHAVGGGRLQKSDQRE
jgi:hypothetical protein